MIWKRSRTKSIFNGLPKDNSKALYCTLGLHHHGPLSPVRYFRTVASSSSSEFVEQNFLKTEFPTTHKIPFTMPQCWVLHVSFPLMLWDITLVNDLIQRATSMTVAAHLMAHDARVMWPELSPIFTCSSGAWFWSLRQGTFHNETRIVYLWCPLAIKTSLVQTPIKFMSDSVTPMRTGLAHLPSVRCAEVAWAIIGKTSFRLGGS